MLKIIIRDMPILFHMEQIVLFEVVIIGPHLLRKANFFDGTQA